MIIGYAAGFLCLPVECVLPAVGGIPKNYNMEGWTQENQEKWDRIRQRIENGERLRPKQDCPQNNDPNGPQRNGPVVVADKMVLRMW